MALSIHEAASGGRRGRRRRARRGALSEINVTPLVDVMLVLLIIFMVSAPLLTAGVPIQLPKTDAAAVNDQAQPITVSIQKDGQVYVGDSAVELDDLPARVQAAGGVANAPAPTSDAGAPDAPAASAAKPIFVRADGAAPYEIVAKVMAKLSTSGFTSIDLITDTAASSRRDRSGAAGSAPGSDTGAP
jgi:biopolymer transport protein TolR